MSSFPLIPIFTRKQSVERDVRIQLDKFYPYTSILLNFFTPNSHYTKRLWISTITKPFNGLNFIYVTQISTWLCCVKKFKSNWFSRFIEIEGLLSAQCECTKPYAKQLLLVSNIKRVTLFIFIRSGSCLVIVCAHA